jgi:hypothetical protein
LRRRMDPPPTRRTLAMASQPTSPLVARSRPRRERPKRTQWSD